ncbi:hypothetical protein [Brevibacillus laterosporus]|uniref:hypothetical protein n=1 Tax=Brevibacillus laterosporus TaxID=1465 RepID=UPI000B9C53EE|nr:hypothetical protein [Brevibacillus laterosporus]
MIFKNKAIQVESLQHLLFLYASSITAPGVYARKSGNAMYRGKKHPKEWMFLPTPLVGGTSAYHAWNGSTQFRFGEETKGSIPC